MNEQRSTPRTRTLKGAKIVYGGGSATRNCMEEHLGWRRKDRFGDHHGIPDEFLLLF